MLNVTLVCVGSLKERYWRDAVAEYEKRLSAFCTFRLAEQKEHKLPENPSQKEIETALDEEGTRMLASVSQKAYKIAFCVEGKQFPSEQLSQKLSQIGSAHSEIAFFIGSSYGLSDKMKQQCDLSLSVSELTFPHQLMRVMAMEILYRCFQIQKGTKYHK